jgi:winged helix DNA-binding protein
MRDPLTLRDLNRTLLARQLLLERRSMPVVRALEAVAGIQAQDPVAPLYGLASRLSRFDAAALTRALVRRTVVRGTLMRGTVHLVSARDYRRMEPAMAPMLRGQHQQYLRGRPPMPDVAERTAEARAMAAEPVPLAALRAHFGEDAWWRIRREGRWLYAPVEGRRSGFARSAVFVSADAWLGDGRFASLEESLPYLVRRGLAAFGPMTLADLAAWSGLAVATLRPVVDDGLRLVRRDDVDGRELLDVPRGVVVRGDVPAPPRLLAAFDDTILSHADRTRVIDDDTRRRVIRSGIVDPVVLVDGFVRGRWKVVRARRSAELVVERFGPIPRAHTRALREEAERTLAFAAPEAERRVVRGV